MRAIYSAQRPAAHPWRPRGSCSTPARGEVAADQFDWGSPRELVVDNHQPQLVTLRASTFSHGRLSIENGLNLIRLHRRNPPARIG
jgi:hypothetical protein